MRKNLKFSQSLGKDFLRYKAGKMCGLQFTARYFEGKFFPSSKVQKLGQWFEYMAIGGLPKDGSYPEAEKTAKGELTAPYQKMSAQVEIFKRTLDHYGIKVLHVNEGADWEVDNSTADMDFIGLTTKQFGPLPPNTEFIADIKSTGLLENRWDDRGWDLETLDQKPDLMAQPVHYKYVGLKKTGKDLPFVFFVHSNTNEIDCKIIIVELDSTRLEEHERFIEYTMQEIEAERERGFIARPDIAECGKCAIGAACPKFKNVPTIHKIYY